VHSVAPHGAHAAMIGSQHSTGTFLSFRDWVGVPRGEPWLLYRAYLTEKGTSKRPSI
jgi:hypothetical protein